jgi:hypothetical protein
MATAGPLFPGTTANLSNAGTSENAEAWVNPGNVVSDNATEAQITAATYDSPDISQILVCSNFGFAIPAGSTINGITVEIDRRSIIASSGKDFRVQLAKGTTFASLVGSNKAVPATIWPTSTAVATYGGVSDLWGTTWTAAEVNASSFALFLSAQANIANADVGVDFVRITVTYTEPPAITKGGTVTPTGALAKQAQIVRDGAVTPTGALSNTVIPAGGGGQVTFVGVGATSVFNDASPHDVALPSGVQEGDFLLLTISGRSLAQMPYTVLTGYTDVLAAEGNSGQTLHNLYKFAGSSEGAASVEATAGTNGWTARITAWRGVDPTTPLDVTPVMTEATSADMNALDLTTVTDAAMVLRVYVSGVTTGVHANHTEPIGTFATAFNDYQSTFVDQTASLTYIELATAGATGEADADTQASNQWITQTIALRPESGGGPLTLNVSGGVTPAGALGKQPSKLFAGALTPAGALLKQGLKFFAGTVTPTGTLTRVKLAILPTKAGTVTPTGALTKQPNKALAGTIGSSGLLQRQPRIVRAGAVTPTGTLALLAVKTRLFAGTVVPTGTLAKRAQKLFAGAVTPTGAILKQPQKRFSGALTPSGTLLKSLARTLTGAVTPTGSLALLALKSRSFAGTVTPTGDLLKMTAKRFTSATTPAGALAKQPQKRFTSSTTPTGVIALLTLVIRQFAGTVAPTGTLLKRVGKTLTASMTPTGNLTRQTAKRFTATVTSSGAQTGVKIIPPIFAGGTVAPTGMLVRAVQKTLTGFVTPTGVFTRRFTKLFAGAVSIAGSLTKTIVAAQGGSIDRLIDLRNLLFAADPSIERLSLSGSQPFTFEAETLYVWEDDQRSFPVANDRSTFAYIAVVGVPDRGEQARQIGDPDVSSALDARAALLLNAIRSNQQSSKWDYLIAWVDTDYLTTYGVRGFAIRITGYTLG